MYKYMSIIPIVIISYNNHQYVDNSIKQLIHINPNVKSSIIIMDNNSDNSETIRYLDNLKEISLIRNKFNNGPVINSTNNKSVYDQLPEKFILTDPDLEYNPHMPHDFINILSKLSDQLKCAKIGLAIDISDKNKMYSYNTYFDHYTIWEWESQFWKHKILNNTYEIYDASIDTTFSLINKKYLKNNDRLDWVRNCYRIAGNFTCKHIPFYIENPILTLFERYEYCKKGQQYSSHGKMEYQYITNNYTIVTNRNQHFLIKKTDIGSSSVLSQNKVFDYFDQLLDSNKNVVNVGDNVGYKVMYEAKKSHHVYAIVSDQQSTETLRMNCVNNTRNVTIIEHQLIGHPLFNGNCNGNIAISLIHVDIQGLEEQILNYLYNYHKQHKIPLIINLYLRRWKNKNFGRFPFLSVDCLGNNEFITVLWK